MRDFHFFYSLLLVSAYKKKRESEEKVEVVSTKFQVEKIVSYFILNVVDDDKK